MKISWILLIVLSLLLAAASYGAARMICGSQCDIESAAPGFALLQDYLEMTPDQRQAISQVDAGIAEERLALREQMLDARDHLVDVINDPESTVDDALSAVHTFGDAQREMQANTVRYTYELRQHLTPPQREKMVRTMGRGVCGMTGGPGRGRGMGGRGRGPCSGDGDLLRSGPR